MKNNRITRVFRNEYVFSVFVKILMLVISMLHSVFLARFLGAELKGVAATITSTVALSQVVITCGIHQAYPYFKKERKIDRFTELFINNVYFVYTVLFILTMIIALGSIVFLSLKYIFVLLLTPIFAYENIISYVFLIEKSLKKNFWSLCSSFLETVLIIILYFFVVPNNFYMILAISVAMFTRLISSTVGLKVRLDFKLISIRFIVKMLRFGFFPMLALILTVMNSKIDILMMDWSKYVTTTEVGLYSVGIGISEKILAIPDAIREILLSKLVSGKSEQEVARVTRVSVFFCLIMFIGISLLGKPFLNNLYGAEYVDSFNVLVISSFGAIFMVFLKMISQYNIVKKRQLANFFMLAVSVITNICFNIIFMPQYGIEGVAIASFIGHCVCALCFIVYFTRVTTIHPIEIIIPKKADFALLLQHKKKQ